MLDLAPKGTIGTLYLVHIFAIADTCSVDRGRTTANGLSSVFDVEISE
jgi:hypothetical protein